MEKTNNNQENINIINTFYQKIESRSEKILTKLKFLDSYYKYFYIVFILTFYLIFKQYFVTGMGGDDGRFYLFYPTQYYETTYQNKRYASLEVENGAFYYSNTLYVLSSLEKLGFGYKDFYFLIFFLGFYFFYLSLKEIKKFYNFEGPLSNYFIFFLSLLYPANPLVVDQVWNNHWASIFTIIGTPLIFLVFLKLIFKSLKYIEIFFYNLLFTALSLYFANLVQLQVTIIFLIVLTIFYLLFNHREIKYFLPRAILLIFLFLASNFYWIYGLLLNRTPSPYETVNTTDANAALTNMKISLEYYQTFNNFNFIFLNGVNPNSSFDVIYYLSLSFFALIIIFSIFYYSYFVINNIFKKQKFEYFGLSIFSSLILIGYLQSISLSKFGIDVFLYLSKYIFVLNGLRNYINKVPMTYSLVVLVTILIVYIFLNKKYKSIAVVFLIVTIVFSIVSLRNLTKLEDYKFNLSEGYIRTTSFDAETIELVKYLNSEQPFQRTAYFPLSIGPWSIIKNHETKELYIGHSPLLGLAGIDDLNGMFNIEGLGLLNKRFPNENFLEMEPEKIIFRLKFLGVNKLVVNNTIDLRNSNLMGYPRTDKYPEILEFVKNNLRLDFETKNKSYSVYDVNKDQIQFKKYMYKPSESEKLNFYSVNFEEASFTFSDISDNFFNYFPSKPTLEEENLDIFWDNFGNKIIMKYIEPEETSIQQAKDEMFYSLKVEGKNVLRIKIDHPKDVFNVDVAVDDKNIPCSNKVFNKNSKCNIFKNIKPQILNDSLVYTLESGPNSPNYIYVSIVNKKPKELNIKEINTKFIVGDTNLIKYNPFSVQERQRYLDKYFVKNPSGPSYQIPKKLEVVRKDKDTYKIDIKLNDKNLPLILTLKNAYNTKWELEGKGIKKQTNFNSDVVFNGWIIEPNGDTDTLELTIKYKDSKIREYIQPVNYLAINLCLLIVLTYIIYGTYKILIRKFWR